MNHTYGRLAALALAMLLLLPACGAPAASAGREEAESAAASAVGPVYLSELMSSNKATLADAKGDFPDWLELHNSGEKLVSLEGWRLERDGKSCALPPLELAPGEYRLLTAAELGELRLSKGGCALRLLDAAGALVDSLELPALEADTSACRESDGSLRLSRYPSPGFANDDAGYRAFQETLQPRKGEPALGEAMVYNLRHLGIDGSYFDWVEITNPWDAPLRTAGWFLSDKGSNRRLFALPDRTLQPGEGLVVYCSAEPMPEGYLNSGFSLGATGEQLFLSRPDGTLADYMSLHDIPVDCSMGRMGGEGGFWYFGEPTPGKPNADGRRLIAEKPVALTSDGVFEDVETLQVQLAGEGEIRYTLDGSMPGEEDMLYLEPIEIDKTCVLRAVCLREGYLSSESLDLSFILNEGHSLPVLSLVTEPGDMLGPQGLYTLYSYELERPASFSLFDGEERLQIRCGVKLHGATSRVREKKSFKLLFRDRYEGALEHDLFHNGVTRFDSILLRMPQEGRPTSYIRDTLMHQLAIELFPSLPAQDHRYAVLYLNGSYWGIYDLREAHSEAHYARHYNVPETFVTQRKGDWGHDVPAEEVAKKLLNGDLSDAALYAYAREYLDLESILGWCILEAYSGNFDANSPNMRFYWDDLEQRLHYALVDLDLGFFSYEGFDIPFSEGYAYQRLAAKLMENEDFRDALLTRLGELLRGEMSEERMHQRIDALAEQLRPEAERDMLRWNNKLRDWESMVRVLHEFIDVGEGRSRELIKSLKTQRFVDSEDLSAYYADFGF